MVEGTVLVTGATGNTGKALVELLRQRGVPVRAMVRSGSAREQFDATTVETVVADFDNAEAVAAALTGVQRAYLVTPSSERAQAQQERFVEMAAKAGLRHVVKLSQLSADEASPVRFLRYHAAVERRIRELGVQFTFLRPNLYFQGLLALSAPIREHSRIFTPIGDAAVSAVDVRDIAAVAATVLTEPGHLGATYPITGPAAITHAEIATAIGAVLGREVTFVDVRPAAFAANLRDVLPDWQVEGLLEDYAHYRRGEAADVLPTVAQVTGRAPRTVADFARDYVEAFR
jgi:uncharacterized protein YbjT (DUF2867 family)